MARKTKAIKPPKKKEWKSFSPEAYQQGMANLVHFSAKTTNSNTPAFGVRLGTQSLGMDYPYVAVSTISGRVPLDYQDTADKAIHLAVQVEAVIEGKTEIFTAAPPADEVAVIRRLSSSLSKSAHPKMALVSKRLRQIIVQDADGNDITLTPLQSAGFSAVLSARLDAESEQILGIRLRARSLLGLGGSNAQNVGQHVRAMQKPLWFSAPTQNPLVREAWRLHYKGVDRTLPQQALQDFQSWRANLLLRHGSIPSTARTRSDLKAHLSGLVAIWLARGGRAASLLRDHQDKLPQGKLLDERLDVLQQGLVDTTRRSIAWRQEFARQLLLEIRSTEIRVGGGLALFGINGDEAQGWLSIIEDLL